MLTITKIIIHNFKRFKDLTLDVNPDINIFIGDNESGKSTILQAIDLVARGSRTRIENIGLDRLFNVESMTTFMNGNRDMSKLPELYIELYLENQTDSSLVGKNNSLEQVYSGIRLRCYFNEEYSKVVSELLKDPNAPFPLEFYNISFDTFAGEPFIAYSKKLKSLFIDNSAVGSTHSMREYVNDIYHYHLTDLQRVNTRYAYKDSKIKFQTNNLAQYNEKIAPYSFAIKETSEDNIETDITLVENDIPIENKGTGMLCFIKTQLALNRSDSEIDTVLIEEPENHLSYMKMLELISLIQQSKNRQLFISTHSDLIATRLNLQKCLLFNSASTNVSSLASLNSDTANFFMKAPDNNMLQFVLSNKTILVEGDAEFILMEAMYKKTCNKDLYANGIGVIAVDGKCFKRYLEIAKILRNQVVVITDNDKDYDKNITDNYSDFLSEPNIKISSDRDPLRYTFEVCIYMDNKKTCDTEFQSPRRKLETLEYMIDNKADAAFALSKNIAESLIVPQYIQEALKWIDE